MHSSRSGRSRRRQVSFERLEPRRLLATVAINSGAVGVDPFLPDQFFVGGRGFNAGGATIDLSAIADQNPAPAAVYTTERSGAQGGDFQYVVPGLDAGDAYTVRLHFAEVFWQAAGQRTFDVDINGAKVLDDYDVFVAAGGHDKAVIEEFTTTADVGGAITIDFFSEINNAKVSAVEIVEIVDAPTAAWSAVAPSPIAVFEGQGAAVGEEHYIIGGFIDNLDVTNEVHSYAPATDTWTRLADFPEITEEIITQEGVATGEFITGGLTHGSTAVDGEKIYVVGGFVGESPGQATAVVSVFDTATNTWTRTTSLPEPRGGGGVAVVGRQLHYFGGGTRTFGEVPINDEPNHWVLDLGATDSPLDDGAQWTALADLPIPRNHLAGAVIDGLIYAVGGQFRANEKGQNQQVLEAYDPATDTWTRLADIPIPLGHLMASVVVAEGRLITIGGVTNDGNPAGQDGTRRTATVFSYDPVADEWSTLESLPDERQSPAVGLVDGQIIVASGASSLGREFSTFSADARTLLGLAPNTLSVSQSAIDFGGVATGESASVVLTLTNEGQPGDASITIDPSAAGLAPTSGPFGFDFGVAAPIVLAPGASTTVTVTYSPTAEGAAAATLSLPHDGANDPITVAIAGSGVAPAPSGDIVYRVNAGGAAIAGDPDWVGDTNADPSGFSNYDPNAVTSGAFGTAQVIDTSLVPGVPEALFQTERFDRPNQPNLEWDFAVTPGDYEVRLYFAETFSGGFTEGFREFDVEIEGVKVLDDYDVFAEVGALTGVVKSFAVTSDGNLDIDFLRTPGKNNPTVKGIEIVSIGGAESLVASATTLDFGSVDTGESAQLTVTLTNDGQTGDPAITIDPSAASLAQDAATFAFEFVASAPIVLAPGQSTDVTVTFAPTAAGGESATLSIPHGGLNSPVAIALAGEGADQGGFQQVSFGKSELTGETDDLVRPTSIQFGPDGRLYVAQQDGLIRVYDVQRNGPNDYEAIAEEVITLVADLPNRDDDGTLNPTVTGRLVTGLLVTGTAANPVLYVTSGDPRIGGGPTGADLNLDTNSGIISRLTWNGSSWDMLDVVRGLPRSDENHTANGMALDEATNTLYVAIGGNTNAGAPSNNFAFLPEYALSAAILSVDLNAIGETTYDIPTLDDEDQPGPDATDPFGGNDGKNQAIIVPGGPVQVHSSGFRNPYDVVFTSEGRLYSVDNGANAGWGDVPVGEGPEGLATNDVNEPGASYPDQLHFIDAPGYYAGHPNPTRSNPANTFNDTNPQSPVPAANPIESDFLIPGIEDGALALFATSTNGIAEYTADEFGGELQGDLVIASFDNTIKRVKLDADGDEAVSVQNLFTNVGFRPLDVTAPATGEFAGSIWVVDIALENVIVFEPSEGGGGSEGDADGDGYADDDELANGTDPNSAADVPADNDGDFLSDLLDVDDDNDGKLDTADAYAIDFDNGATTPIGVAYDWENEGANLGGLLGLGFTGLMTNGVDDYSTLFDAEAVTAGGAAGVFTIDSATAGTALGAANSQEQAFQIGFNAAGAVEPFAAETSVISPFNGVTPQAGQQMGLFLGTGDQDNFVQIVVAGDNGGSLQLVAEIGGDPVMVADVPLPVPGPTEVELRLTANPLTFQLQASYSIDGAGYVNLGPPIAIPAAAFGGSLAAGLISTNPSGTPLPVTWDYLRVVPVTPAAAVSALTVSLPGDFDGSGAVDDLDRQVWASTLGATTDLRADGNGNGVVDLGDYSIWRDNLGRVAPILAAPESPAEPPLLTLPILIPIAPTTAAVDEALADATPTESADDDTLLLLSLDAAGGQASGAANASPVDAAIGGAAIGEAVSESDDDAADPFGWPTL